MNLCAEIWGLYDICHLAVIFKYKTKIVFFQTPKRTPITTPKRVKKWWIKEINWLQPQIVPIPRTSIRWLRQSMPTWPPRNRRLMIQPPWNLRNIEKSKTQKCFMINEKNGESNQNSQKSWPKLMKRKTSNLLTFFSTKDYPPSKHTVPNFYFLSKKSIFWKLV